MSVPPTNPGQGPHFDPKAQAAATKAYAKAMRPWFKKKRFVIPVAAVTLMVVGGIASAGEEGTTTDSAVSEAAASTSETGKTAVDADSKAAPTPAGKQAAKPVVKTKKAEVLTVDAGEMLKEFENNELAGDSKYKGKKVRVSGTIDKIDTELLDDEQYVLRISDGDEFAFLTVNCNDMSKKELSTLAAGEDVTAVGTFDDGGDLGVELKNCELA